MADRLELLELGDDVLYFDEPCPPRVAAQIDAAAHDYGQPVAEQRLLYAYFLAPEQLSVLVALYRYYFYQHRLEDALVVAERALEVSARRLQLVGGWRSLGPHTLGEAAMRSMGMLRFHLLALKGSAVILLRLGRVGEACTRLRTIADVDRRDALGALLDSEIAAGRPEDRPCWLLKLEICQLRGQLEVFEEMAINYAVTFEISPPSWEFDRVADSEPAPLELAAAVPLAAGLVLSWARALGEFGATILFAGNLQGRTQTMPLLIYSIVVFGLSAVLFQKRTV